MISPTLTTNPTTTTVNHSLSKGACTTPVISPIVNAHGERVILGETVNMSKDDALEALQSALNSYDKGMGTWANAPLATRIEAIEKFNDFLIQKRDEIAELLMWEICKTKGDAYKEIDRTIEYMQRTVNEVQELTGPKRKALGTMLLLGPSNYPINETLTVMLPALLMGNSVIIKTPKVGTLAVLALADGFKQCFPEGVVSVLNGDGRELVSPIIASEKLNAFCFIGGTNTAKYILQNNPIPHRLKTILGLGAKNPAIVLPDADLKKAAAECVKGALGYNGQRCTALKAIFVHRAVADDFAKLVAKEVEGLQCGNPWEVGVSITPIEPSSIAYMEQLIDDATATSGARIINQDGAKTTGNLFTPAVLYPVALDSRVAHEEQFGPVVPIIPFNDQQLVIDWMKDSPFAQQASIFTTNKSAHKELLTAAENIYSRININAQCQRGPDHLPFTASKDSGMGVLSIKDALLEFSRPVIIQGE